LDCEDGFRSRAPDAVRPVRDESHSDRSLGRDISGTQPPRKLHLRNIQQQNPTCVARANWRLRSESPWKPGS